MRKLWIWIALGMMGVGMGLFVILGFMVDFDFARFSIVKYVTNTHEITEEFHSVSVDTTTADISFKLAGDGKCRVICLDQEKVIYDVQVIDGTLVIFAKDERNWMDHLSIFNLKSPSVTVYLPEGDYRKLSVENTTGDQTLSGSWNVETLNVKATTGDISVSGVKCSEKASLTVTTGDIFARDMNCGHLSIHGSTGDIELSDVLVSGVLQTTVTTGDTRLDRCDAMELYLKATTGEVSATLLTEKQISAHATTGEVDVPQSDAGGRCEISTTTGDITVNFE